MQIGPKLAGFRYLYATTSPDTVVVHVRDILFRKYEWIVTKENHPEVVGKIFIGLPQYLLANGTCNKIANELERWRNPLLSYGGE